MPCMQKASTRVPQEACILTRDGPTEVLAGGPLVPVRCFKESTVSVNSQTAKPKASESSQMGEVLWRSRALSVSPSEEPVSLREEQAAFAGRGPQLELQRTTARRMLERGDFLQSDRRQR